jgi:HTH domain.
MSEKLKDKYITIKELAKEVNITTQAIYQRIDKD